jgi:hypothetical protein
MSIFTSTLVYFTTVIVIIVFFNDYCFLFFNDCTFHFELLQVSVDCMHAHHRFVSDATRFPATSTMAEGDQGHLHFPSLPEDHRKWPEWLATISQISLANTRITPFQMSSTLLLMLEHLARSECGSTLNV